MSPSDEAVATLYVFVVHFAEIVFGSVDGGFGNELTEQGRREARLAKLHDGIAHFFVLRDQAPMRIPHRSSVSTRSR